jgi:membrane-bound lytic murein transglycosylase B
VPAQQHPGAEEFAAKAAAEYQLIRRRSCTAARRPLQQSIVDAISRPAEAAVRVPADLHHRERIRGGVDFWREHEALAAGGRTPGVEPQIIVAIIGVETLRPHHRQLPRWMLATLSFYYPDTGNDRSDFFPRAVVALPARQRGGLPLREVTGPMPVP